MKRFTLIACLLCLLGYAQAKERVIDRPRFIAWSSTSLEIDKVVLSDTATVLHIKAIYRPNNWIKIASGSFLRLSNGEMYPLRRGIGITPDKEFWLPESGEADFQLVFPPLPTGITAVDFSEGNSEGAFQIWGIELKGKSLPKLVLPKEAIVHKVDLQASLPEVKIVLGTATLKGKLLDYRPGMIEDLHLNPFEPVKGFSEGISIKPNADGSFSTEIPVTGITPASLYLYGKQLSFFLTPGETSEVIINTRELCRQQSKLHKGEKPYAEAVYINGPLAGLAQEMNQDAFRNILIKDYDALKEKTDADANQYKAYVMSQYAEREKKIDQSSLSQAAKQLARMGSDISAAQDLYVYPSAMTRLKIEKKEITREEGSAYYTKLQKELPADYYAAMKSFERINTPSALLSSYYTEVIYMFNPIIDKLKEAWGTDKGTYFDITSAFKIYQGIKDFAPLDDEQKAKLASISPVYKAMIEVENNKLLQKIEANKKKSGFTVNQAGEVSNEDLFASIVSKFRGKVVLVDFWATWCGPCRMANKAMIPMKEDLKEKEVVYVYLTGETSPLKTWENMIPDIHGEHFRVTEAQWKFLMSEFKVGGVPTYILVDRQGGIVYKTTGFPGVDTMKAKILEAVDKK